MAGIAGHFFYFNAGDSASPAARCLVTTVHCIPVDHVPPGGEVVRSAVLVLQVVGVFPYVVAEDREVAVRQGVVLVGGADDRELAVAARDEPGPATAESFHSGVVELRLEGLEVAK